MWKDQDKPTIIGVAVLMVALGAFSSFSQFQLAVTAGFPRELGWVLPVATDATAVVATRVFISPHYVSGIRNYAGGIVLVCVLGSFVGAAMHAVVPSGVITQGWEALRLTCGGAPSLCLAAVIHLASMLPSGRIAHAVSSAAVLTPAVEETVSTQTIDEVVPETVPPAKSALHVVEPPPVERVAGAPDWLVDGMKAWQAMYAYMDRHPDTTVTALDRFGVQYLNTSMGYASKIRRQWAAERKQQKASGQ